MKVSADIKPKLELESPTQRKPAPVSKPKRAVKAKAGLLQPKTEPDQEDTTSSLGQYTSQCRGANPRATEEDVKPDVRELENLLDGLNLDR
jgi:hypothetical protein